MSKYDDAMRAAVLDRHRADEGLRRIDAEIKHLRMQRLGWKKVRAAALADMTRLAIADAEEADRKKRKER